MEDVLTIYLLKSTILPSQIGCSSSELLEILGIELSCAISLLMFLSGSPLHPMLLDDKTYFYTFCFSQLQDSAWIWQTLSNCFLSTSNGGLSAKDFRAFLGKWEDKFGTMEITWKGNRFSTQGFQYRIRAESLIGEDCNRISIFLLSWLLEIIRFDCLD